MDTYNSYIVGFNILILIKSNLVDYVHILWYIIL